VQADALTYLRQHVHEFDAIHARRVSTTPWAARRGTGARGVIGTRT
jgi:hypothetical protein